MKRVPQYLLAIFITLLFPYKCPAQNELQINKRELGGISFPSKNAERRINSEDPYGDEYYSLDQLRRVVADMKNKSPKTQEDEKYIERKITERKGLQNKIAKDITSKRENNEQILLLKFCSYHLYAKSGSMKGISKDGESIHDRIVFTAMFFNQSPWTVKDILYRLELVNSIGSVLLDSVFKTRSDISPWDLSQPNSVRLVWEDIVGDDKDAFSRLFADVKANRITARLTVRRITLSNGETVDNHPGQYPANLNHR